ncbi:hypothetical protein D9758_004375 [Tetrapyrgos nigripes]|uniref:RING-type E3 ubiquitin transferase n=1 Tax=Tetrapyrgos nigripes TaxID=182062 RepID=A0A8H5GNQ5_9AGAR|nr:hypothetical protein D9758_004375 [Tetrapyrgos nigripes]
MTDSPSRSPSPPAKRPKLEAAEDDPEKLEKEKDASEEIPEDLEENNCSICLQPMRDRTLLPVCSHEFCFECLLIWSEKSRRCPLCTQNMGEHVIHHIRGRYDYQKHYLPPLRSKSPQMLPMARTRAPTIHRRIPREIRERSRRERREREEADRLDRAIERRKWIYRHDLYAKHVPSNSYTRYRPCPTPGQFSSSQDLISRATSFLRRELRVWPDLDVEFLTTFTISLMKSIDIRSESAVKLLAEFLDIDEPYVEGRRHRNAEHFAHEVYSYLRSPFKDLFVYDTIIQYDAPLDEPSSSSSFRDSSRRWQPRSSHDHSRSSHSHSRSRSPSLARPRGHRNHRPKSRSRSIGLSWSPSGRSYPNAAERERHLSRDYSPRHGRSGRSTRRRSPSYYSRSRSRSRSLPGDEDAELPSYHNSRGDVGSGSGDKSRPSRSGMIDQHSDLIVGSGGQDLHGNNYEVQSADGDDHDLGGVSLLDFGEVSLKGKDKGKGKVRASALIMDPKSESDTQGSVPTATTSSTTTTTGSIGQKRSLPPRMRNLQESVQAHLASDMSKSQPKRSSRTTLTSSQPSKSAPSSSITKAESASLNSSLSTKPSLLSRLSNRPAYTMAEDHLQGVGPPHTASGSHGIGLSKHHDVNDVEMSPANNFNSIAPGPRPSTDPATPQSSSMPHAAARQSLLARLTKEKDQLRNDRSATDGNPFEPSTNISIHNSSSFHTDPEAHDDAQRTATTTSNGDDDDDDMDMRVQKHSSSTCHMGASASFSSTPSKQIPIQIHSNDNGHGGNNLTSRSPVQTVSDFAVESHHPQYTTSLRDHLLNKLEERRRVTDFHTTESNLNLDRENRNDNDFLDDGGDSVYDSFTGLSESNTGDPAAGINNADSMSITTGTSAIPLDTIETRLRLRAQLKARLATEKRYSAQLSS